MARTCAARLYGPLDVHAALKNGGSFSAVRQTYFKLTVSTSGRFCDEPPTMNV